MFKFETSVKRLKTALVAGVVIAASTAPRPAAAQDSLEEIVVTARQREVSLQDAPVAVSVVTGTDFDRAGVLRLDNFNGYVPGLVVARNDGAGRIAAVRGIGWETPQNLGSQPGVLLYVDGVYLANPLAMGLDLGELERVEVFRGPQGTEFGQGAVGGAVNLVTRRPDFDKTSGSVELGYGTYNVKRGRVSLNAPLSDAWALRATAQKYERDGFAEIEGGALHGYHLDDADSLSGQLAVAWRPSSAFSAYARVSLYDSDQHAAAQKNADDPNPDPRALTQDYPGVFNLENHAAALIMEWQTPAGVTVKSLTGWQALRKEQSVDGDRLTEDTLAINRRGVPENWDVLPYWDNDSNAVSQELSAAYRGDRLDWVLGAYYLRHENANDFLEATGAAPFSASNAALPREQLTVENLPPFASDLNFNEARIVTRTDYAFYGQVAYQVGARLAVTAGLRYQEEDQADRSRQFFGAESRLDADAAKLTWKAGVDLRLAENHLVYGLASTGWKNGGANPGAVNNGALRLSGAFRPEQVTAFEIGSRNAFLDDRVRLNVTAFYYDHEHLQFIYEDPTPFAGGVGTVPEAEEYGIEAELNWLAPGGWRIEGMLAWQDGQLRSDLKALDVIDFRDALAPGVHLFSAEGQALRRQLAENTSLKGNKPPRLVDVTARLALANTLVFARGSALSFRAEYIHRGKFQARVFNNPEVDAVPAYDLVNLYLSWSPAALPLDFGLTITNVFDEDGVNNVFSNPYGIWSVSSEYIPPREIIGSIKFNW